MQRSFGVLFFDCECLQWPALDLLATLPDASATQSLNCDHCNSAASAQPRPKQGLPKGQPMNTSKDPNARWRPSAGLLSQSPDPETYLQLHGCRRTQVPSMVPSQNCLSCGSKPNTEEPKQQRCTRPMKY
eukprot:5392148-Amphidinium_carterae.1